MTVEWPVDMTDTKAIIAFVLVHLETQGRQAVNARGTCSYRAFGRSCAVGCVLPDKVYRTAMEGRMVGYLIKEFGLTYFASHEQLWLRLQALHDCERNWNLSGGFSMTGEDRIAEILQEFWSDT